MYIAIFKLVFMCTLLHLYSEEIYCFHCFLKEESGNGAGVQSECGVNLEPQLPRFHLLMAFQCYNFCQGRKNLNLAQ